MWKSKNILIIVFGILLIIILGTIIIMRDNATLINRNFFYELLSSSKVKVLILDNSYLYIKSNDENNYKIAKELINLQDIENLPINIKKDFTFLNFVWYIVSFVVIILISVLLFNIFYRFFKNKDSKLSIKTIQNVQNNEFSNIEFNNKVNMNITFNDIAGIKEIKADLLEVIDYLKYPNKYQEMGISLPKGVLLVGPPGVGKTMIAKAVASESKVPFFYQSGSSFAQIYVGVGAKRVRELFYRAKISAPSIIFIDEIDAVGKARGNNRSDEREATLNQLLVEMDGFEDNKGVIVIGATNNIDVLDAALLRAGRFDRRIYIDLPNLEEREYILMLYLKNKKHSIDIKEIARQLVGFSGASIASLVNEASLNAFRRGSDTVVNEDFFNTRDKIIFGFKKQLSFNDNEKDLIALYQAAKAMIAYWCDIDFDKILLIGDSFKNADRYVLSKTELVNRIKVALSGSVVLELFNGEVCTINKDDIALAKDIAKQMSEQYAMGDRIISDINDELSILNNINDELKIFFKNAKPALDSMKEILIKNEKITKMQVKEILNNLMFT